MRLRPVKHLEKRGPKCKMHTRKTVYTFFCIYDWSTKKTEPNQTRGFSQNQTKTELEKFIPHIPNGGVCVISKDFYMPYTLKRKWS